MRCTVIHSETCQCPYNFTYMSVLVQCTTYPKSNLLTLNTSQEIKCFRSLQDHSLNIPQFHKANYSVPKYRCFMLNYKPLINGKSIEWIEVKL